MVAHVSVIVYFFQTHLFLPIYPSTRYFVVHFPCINCTCNNCHTFLLFCITVTPFASSLFLALSRSPLSTPCLTPSPSTYYPLTSFTPTILLPSHSPHSAAYPHPSLPPPSRSDPPSHPIFIDIICTYCYCSCP